MSTPIIGGGDKVRQALVDVENNSVGWPQAQRDDAEACLSQMASCLKEIASGGNGESFPFPQP